MAYEGVEETCGSSQGGLTDGTTLGGEADKLLPEFLDGFVSTYILVGILGWPTSKNIPRGSRERSALTLAREDCPSTLMVI